MMRRKIYSLVLLTAMVGSIAFTASADSKKKEVVRPDVDEELKFKAGDEEGNELKALKAELLISQSDQRALDQLNKLLKKYKGTGLEASLHFRLAEIYMRRAKTATFFEVHRDSASAVRFSPLATQNADSKAWISKAVKTYDLIEKQFVQFRDMDLVLFNNAFARQILGQNNEAMIRYRRVIEDFSSSPLVPDCHLSLGEALFNDKKFQLALEEFQKIRDYPDSRVYPYGIYKGAWALYNLGKTGDGLKQLEEVVAYSKNSGDDGTSHLDLSREALDDMVIFYEDTKRPSEAVAYFRDEGGDTRAGELVLKLGKIYERHGKFANLEIVYLDLIKTVPLATERPEMHHDLMEGFENTKDRGHVIEQLETLSELCQENSAWSKAQKADSRKDCWTQLEDTGKLYAAKWHKEFRVTKKVELGLLTMRAYEALLRNQKKISGEDKFRYAYADLLYQAGEFRKASDQYSKTAHVTADGTIKHDSSYAALVAFEKATGDKWSDVDEREFARLAQDYISMNPKGQYVTDIRFKKAFIAYEKGRYDESAPQLRDLAVNFYSNPRGLKAAHLYLDVLNLQKKYELLRDESQMFLTKFKSDAETFATFTKIHQEAFLTVDQNLEASGNYSAALAGYLAFVKEAPTSPLADKALYNGIRCANLAGEFTTAAKLSEQLIAQYPASPYKIELGHALVVLYEAQAQLSQAARAVLMVAEWEKSETNKPWPAMLQAADYKALDNDFLGATALYNKLIEKAPHSKEGIVALQRVEALAEKGSEWQRQAQLLEQMVEWDVQPAASLAMNKLVQRAYTEGDLDKAFRLAKKTIGMHGADHVSHKALAESRLVQAKILEKESTASSIKARPERLSIVLAIKSEKLEHAQKAYQDVISYKDKASAIEALVHLAKCYEQFALALNQIEAPADAPAADKKKFLAEIENMSLPIEEKNAETLQLALKEARDYGFHDGTVLRVQKELDRLSKRGKRNVASMDVIQPAENVLPVVSGGAN